eukprot:CAMPEP_0168463176 /NCGR_PEP_ID=MMETSP0228-20121227/54916_1 /TAXON_ID=133427 /ORGANISM="Protoceratium reticulatum, Strain CCCM 535 (=CCMP 1889)" /LENGTH=31 /DNA_ID= /DNA_START= /DNA_END= /DNA_ORIENTATION=
MSAPSSMLASPSEAAAAGSSGILFARDEIKL